jgi:hypothetical protein
MVPRAGIAAFTLPSGANPARYPLVRVAGAGEVPTLEMLSGTVDTISLLSGADGIACIAPDTGVGFGDRVAWVPVTDRFA